MKKVITYGTFDLFHEGHYKLLQRAKELGDYLVVGVTTLRFDEERGKINVSDSLIERIDNVRKTGFADEVIVEEHDGQKIEDIKKMEIDIFAVGSDWTGTFDYLEQFCKVVYLERTPEISSTMLRERKHPIVSMGVVGTGRIAPRFINEAKFVSGINIRCAFNPHKRSADRFSAKTDIDCASVDFKEFLNMVDAVYIASPHETHYEYAKEALNNKKHVLCEKPIGFTKKQVEELFDLAKEKQVVLMEAIKTAFCPGFNQMLNVIKSGKIGEVRDVEACFSRLTSPRVRERIDSEYGGGFLEFGSYTILPIIKLLGTDYKDIKIDSVLDDNGIDLYTKINFCYNNGLATSKTGVGVKSEGQLVIAGTKGYILASSPWWLTRKFEVRYENPKKVDSYTPKFWGDGLRYEISEFVHLINKCNIKGYSLTPSETIAMADIVEKFMEKRKSILKDIIEKNKSADIKIWAHRGCSFDFPENTIPAFEAACKINGITGIELDIQLSKDNKIMVFHDEKLERLIDEAGNLRDYSCKELQKMKFSQIVGNKEEGKYYIPTMEEVFELVKPYCIQNGLLINIELKNGIIFYEGMEKQIIELVEKYNLKEYIVYSSFNNESLKILKNIQPDASIGFLNDNTVKCIETAEENGYTAIHPNADKIEKIDKNQIKTVRAWNSQEAFFGYRDNGKLFSLVKLREMGVTDIFTNYPEKYLY